MDQKIITFGETKIEKQSFLLVKGPVYTSLVEKMVPKIGLVSNGPENCRDRRSREEILMKSNICLSFKKMMGLVHNSKMKPAQTDQFTAGNLMRVV